MFHHEKHFQILYTDLVSAQKKDSELFAQNLKKSQLPDLNGSPALYEGAALPDELSWRDVRMITERGVLVNGMHQ